MILNHHSHVRVKSELQLPDSEPINHHMTEKNMWSHEISSIKSSFEIFNNILKTTLEYTTKSTMYHMHEITTVIPKFEHHNWGH